LSYVQRIEFHLTVSRETYQDDIAVLVLSAPLSMGSRVRAIELAEFGSEPSGSCVATGWGFIRHDGTEYPEVLQKVTLQAVDREVCENKFADVNPIRPGMTCASGNFQGPCNVRHPSCPSS
jgi:hypothetical protein